MDKSSFHLHTEHSALTWLMNFNNLKGQTACCIQRLQEQDFTSKHLQGRKHNNADALSWQPCHVECMHYHIKQVWAIVAVAADTRDPATLRREQLNDHDKGPILEEVEAGQWPE
jgi:hypothetical protein